MTSPRSALWAAVLATSCTARTHLPGESTADPGDDNATAQGDTTQGDTAPALLEFMAPSDDEAVGAYLVFSGRCTTGVTVSMSYGTDVTGPATIDCTDDMFSGAVILSGSPDTRTLTAEQAETAGVHSDTVLVNYRAGFNSTTAVTGFNGPIYSIAVDPISAKVYVGGDFTTYGATPAAALARLNTDGTLDTDFDIGMGFNSAVLAVAIDSAGRIYVGGWFDAFDGTADQYVVRLLTDGSRDPAFTPAPLIDSGFAFAYDANLDAIYVGGWFSGGVARLLADGSVDAAFSIGAGFNSDVESIVLSPNHVYVTGWFSAYRGTASHLVARLNPDGSHDATFQPALETVNYAKAVATNPNLPQVFVGGGWMRVEPTSLSANYVRLSDSGELAADFDPSMPVDFNGQVNTLLFDTARDRVIAGGEFTTYEPTPSGGVACVLPNGVIDSSFAPGSGFDDTVSALAIAGERIYVGGQLTTYNGVAVSNIAILKANGSLEP